MIFRSPNDVPDAAKIRFPTFEFNRRRTVSPVSLTISDLTSFRLIGFSNLEEMVESPEQKRPETGDVSAKTLAIVPFRLLRGDQKTPLGIGLADALTIRLHAVEGLKLRPTGTVLPLADKIADPFELGRRLGVDYVLNGHISPVAERTRFSVQLLDIHNQSVLWASRFDENETDIFHLEDSISDRIVELLVPHLEEKSVERAAKLSEKLLNSPDTSEQFFAGNTNTEELLHDSQSETLVLPGQTNKRRKINRLLITAILFAALTIGAVGYFFWQKKTVAPRASATLIVLPFKSENSATNSVGNGLADALSDRFGVVRAVSVLSPSVGREIAKNDGEIADSARKLGADFVLRGSLDTMGDKTELTAELLEAETGKNLFVEKISVPNADLLTLQSRVAERVLQALSIAASPEEKARLNKRLTENRLAYELYLVGRQLIASRAPGDLRRALQIFNQVVERDPNFVLPYVGIADCYSLLALYDIPPPPNAYKIAEENALLALRIDPDLSEAHASLGYIRFNGERRPFAAELEFRRAIELNPSYAPTYHWYAISLSGAGKHDEAAAKIETAKKLNPTASIVRSGAAIVNFRARRFDAAEQEAQAALKLNPASIPAHKIIRWIYQAQGDYAKALAAFQKERSYSGAAEEDLGWLIIEAQVEALGNRRERARNLLEKALNDSFVQQNPTSYANEIALAYAALDDRENAFVWLEKAFQANDHSVPFLGVEPRFDRIKQDARFAALVDKSILRN